MQGSHSINVFKNGNPFNSNAYLTTSPTLMITRSIIIYSYVTGEIHKLPGSVFNPV